MGLIALSNWEGEEEKQAANPSGETLIICVQKP